MYNGYNKIFWGIFILTFNIKLGIVKILPSFVGFLIVLSGINEICEESKIDKFQKLKNLGILMTIIAFIGEAIDFFVQGQMGYFLPNIIWIIFYMCFEFVFFFKLLEASIEYLKINNYNSLEGEYIGKLRNYTIFSILNIILLSISLIFNMSSTTIPGIIAVILRIYLMTMIYGLRNTFKEPEDSEEE